MTAVDDLTPLQALDVALVQLCGLQVIEDAKDTDESRERVTACSRVLDALLEQRLHLPLQRADVPDTPTREPAC